LAVVSGRSIPWSPDRRRRTLSGHALAREVRLDQDRRPESLFGVVLDAYWTSLARDPLPVLLLTALLSLGGVLAVLLGHIVGDLVGQLLRVLS
jgi:hypothetical protein